MFQPHPKFKIRKGLIAALFIVFFMLFPSVVTPQVSYTATVTISILSNSYNFYVNNNLSDLDSLSDIGYHSNFTAQQSGQDSIYDTLTEQNTANSSNSTLLDDDFEGIPWDGNWDTISSDWQEDNFPIRSGLVSASATNNNEGYFTTINLDASRATAIYVDFWFRKDDTESSDFTLYYYDGNNYDLIDELDDNGFDDTWLHFTEKITDAQYFVSNFRVRFDATLGGGENVWIDDVSIIEETQDPDNFELDLEVQWTDVDFSQTNEELCINGGSMASEDIRVDAWNGSSWENLIDVLSPGWNNVTLTSYLTSSTFTIRFKGSIETNDSIQDSWEIDATVIHVWS